MVPKDTRGSFIINRVSPFHSSRSLVSRCFYFVKYSISTFIFYHLWVILIHAAAKSDFWPLSANKVLSSAVWILEVLLWSNFHRGEKRQKLFCAWISDVLRFGTEYLLALLRRFNMSTLQKPTPVTGLTNSYPHYYFHYSYKSVWCSVQRLFIVETFSCETAELKGKKLTSFML